MMLRPIHLLFIAALWLAIASRAGALPTEEPKPPEVDPAVVQAEQARIAAAAKAIPTVLCIFSSGGQGGGSGVVISPDGYALTNFHVAKPSGTFMKCGMADGKLYDAVLVGLDPVGDVALIKLFGTSRASGSKDRDDFPAAELADSDEVQVGDACFTMGNPFLLATDFHPSVAYGIVSGIHRYQYPAGTLLEYSDCLQVDAAINPGNSGGPLFDAQGRLLGINGRGSFEKRGRVNVGVGYAISINQIKNFLGDLKSGRIVDHATLGARVATSEDGRVVVSDILENGDAYRRGLRYDDEIVSFAGRPIRSVNALKNILGIFPKDWRVQLTYRHEGENHDTFVRLMGVHTDIELLRKVEGHLPGEIPQPRRPKEDGKPGEAPKPDEPKPKPDPSLKEAVKSPVPAELKKQFEARSGYANYYFNRQNVERLWKGLTSHGDFSKLSGPWTLTGQASANKQVIIRLGNSQCEIELPTGDSKIAVSNGFDSVLSPPDSGGLLPALYLWRKLLVGGPSRFGQIKYEGAAPLRGYPGLYDVLNGVSDSVETRFYCDPADGFLACVEMFPDDQSDPCEVYFGDYREIDGRMLPHRMEVRYGDNVFGVFMLSKFELKKTEATAQQ